MRFAGNAELPKHLYAIGEHYRSRKKYAHARGVYQSVIDDWPGTAKAMWSAQRFILMDIDETEDPNHPTAEVPPEILQAIDDLIVDCNGLPALARAVFYLGEEYFLRIRSMEGDILRNPHRYDNAIKIWEIVINDVAYEKTYTPFTYYLAAYCCEKTGQYDKAIAYYKKLTQDGYRHGRYAYRAPNQLGYIYRHRKKDFEKAAYWYDQQNKLFDKDSPPGEQRYSGASGSKFVCDRAMWSLGIVCRRYLKDYDKAIEVFETYLRQFPQGTRADLAPMSIAQCYMGKGDIATAIETLQTALDEKPDMKYADAYREMLGELQEGAE